MESIQINGLTKTYGKSRGVEDVNLKIKKGEIFGFIGPNVAGKSTTIRCIMNLINKDSGEILLNNNIANKKAYKLKEKIGYLPSEIYLYEDLTVEKMIKYSALFYKKDCTEKINYLTKKLDMDLKKKIDELSLGNQKKLGIILALMHSPKILILDEATSGLDPLMQNVFYEILEEEKSKGTTIFFSSHMLNEIKKICDRVAIIKEGKIVKVDKVQNLTDVNFDIVTIITNEIENMKKDIKVKVIEEKENTIKFIYDKDINNLIKMLSNYKIDKILIEAPSIEEIFIHYYK